MFRKYLENFSLIFIAALVTSSSVVFISRIETGEFVSVGELYGILRHQAFWIFITMLHITIIWALLDVFIFHPFIRVKLIPKFKREVKWKKFVKDWYNFGIDEK